MPEARRDEIEVGKALAFELGTACGFHAFRVTESITKKYWDYVTNSKNRPDPQTIGKFASELKDGKFGSEAVYSSLQQLSKLHRNPVIHPEIFLSVEEAIGIIGLARSIVGAMLEVLPMPPAPPKQEVPPDV